MRGNLTFGLGALIVLSISCYAQDGSGTHQFPASHPSARFNNTMAYDAAWGQIVLKAYPLRSPSHYILWRPFRVPPTTRR